MSRWAKSWNGDAGDAPERRRRGKKLEASASASTGEGSRNSRRDSDRRWVGLVSQDYGEEERNVPAGGDCGEVERKWRDQRFRDVYSVDWLEISIEHSFLLGARLDFFLLSLELIWASIVAYRCRFACCKLRLLLSLLSFCLCKANGHPKLHPFKYMQPFYM
jgi:hypothetical protein